MSVIRRWRATHRLTWPDGEEVDVMVSVEGSDHGPAYTEAEWGTYELADWSLMDGRWYFQGQLFRGDGETRSAG